MGWGSAHGVGQRVGELAALVVSIMSSPVRTETAQISSHWASAEPLRQVTESRTQWRRSFPAAPTWFLPSLGS